jgi:hypothetical protein
MSVHDAAVNAARFALGAHPEHELPILLQAAGTDYVLTTAFNDVPEALGLVHMIAPAVGARSLTFVADAYVASDPRGPAGADDPEGLLASYEHGDLAQRFAEGDPTVSETLTVCTAHRLGLPRITNCPYRRTEHGIEWIEAKQHDAEGLAGRVVDAMRTALMEDGPPDAPTDEEARFEVVAAFLRFRGVQADVTPAP